jgi:arsenite transporter
MTLVEKAQSFIILAAITVGLALGHVPIVAQQAANFILPLLILMLTGVFLHIPVRDFKNAYQYRRVAIASLIINFAWTPLFAWLLGWLFLSDQPALWVGFLMLMVTGPLIELPVLALISQVLLGIKRSGLFTEGTRVS